MRHLPRNLLAPLAVAFMMTTATTAPAWTQTPTEQGEPLDDLIGKGLETILSQMFERAQPHLNALAQDMQGLLNEYQPTLKEMANLVDDIQNYQMPERLENGDIVIRRKPNAPPAPPLSELRKLNPGDGAITVPGLPLPPSDRPPLMGSQPATDI